MLLELEQDLVTHLRESPLAARVRQIDALPDLEGESLVGRFGSDAPAVYVSVGAGAFPAPGFAVVQVGIACVTRGTRASSAARQGDGYAIGLLEMIVAAVALIDGRTIGGRLYAARSWQPVQDDALSKRGLYACVVVASTELQMPTDYTGEAPLCP